MRRTLWTSNEHILLAINACVSAESREGDDAEFMKTCKPLKLIWKLHPCYNEKNTLIIEDVWTNCILNPRNSYIIPPYHLAQSGQDAELLWLAAYLMLVRDEDDVRNASVFKEKKDSPTLLEHLQHTQQNSQLKDFVRARLQQLEEIDSSLAYLLTDL